MTFFSAFAPWLWWPFQLLIDLVVGFLPYRHTHPVWFHIISILVIFLTFRCLCGRKRRPRRRRPKPKKLPPAEKARRLREWKPQPLVPPAPETSGADSDLEVPVLLSGAGPTPTLRDYGQVVNFATFSFLDLNRDPEILQACEEALRFYGVGACGPRGFYGTFDVHVETEDELAKFVGYEDCVLYPFSAAVMTSQIPTYAKKTDVIIMDEMCGYGTQKGAKLTRCRIVKFLHNDINDLRQKLEQIDLLIEGGGSSARNTRKFILVEGMYGRNGSVCEELSRIVELKKKHKCFLTVDDTFGFGVLGSSGRGILEHCEVVPKDVEFYIGSLEHAFDCAGGFVCASVINIRYHRFFGVGYMFSCTLPPFMCVAGTKMVQILRSRGKRILVELGFRIRLFQDELRRALGGVTEREALYSLGWNPFCPIIHLFLPCVGKGPQGLRELKKVAHEMLRRRIFVAVPEREERDEVDLPWSLRVNISVAHSKEELEGCARELAQVVKDLSRLYLEGLEKEVLSLQKTGVEGGF